MIWRLSPIFFELCRIQTKTCSENMCSNPSKKEIKDAVTHYGSISARIAFVAQTSASTSRTHPRLPSISNSQRTNRMNMTGFSAPRDVHWMTLLVARLNSPKTGRSPYSSQLLRGCVGYATSERCHLYNIVRATPDHRPRIPTCCVSYAHHKMRIDLCC